MLVYDVTRRESFDHLGRWLQEARQNAANPDLVLMLVGNKADLESKRQISRAEGKAFDPSLVGAFANACPGCSDGACCARPATTPPEEGSTPASTPPSSPPSQPATPPGRRRWSTSIASSTASSAALRFRRARPRDAYVET